MNCLLSGTFLTSLCLQASVASVYKSFGSGSIIVMEWGGVSILFLGILLFSEVVFAWRAHLRVSVVGLKGHGGLQVLQGPHLFPTDAVVRDRGGHSLSESSANGTCF